MVIGSGLTGLSISHYLSRASIDHLVIGRRPDDSPRLGESLNLEGTLLLQEAFPQLSRYFFPKRDALGYFGDYEVVCDFEVSQRAVSRAIFRSIGYAAAAQFRGVLPVPLSTLRAALPVLRNPANSRRGVPLTAAQLANVCGGA